MQLDQRGWQVYLRQVFACRHLYVVDVGASDVEAAQPGQCGDVGCAADAAAVQRNVLQPFGRDVELVGAERSHGPPCVAIDVGYRRLRHKLHKPLAFHLEGHIWRNTQVANIAYTPVIVDTQHGHTRVVRFG